MPTLGIGVTGINLTAAGIAEAELGLVVGTATVSGQEVLVAVSGCMVILMTMATGGPGGGDLYGEMAEHARPHFPDKSIDQPGLFTDPAL